MIEVSQKCFDPLPKRRVALARVFKIGRPCDWVRLLDRFKKNLLRTGAGDWHGCSGDGIGLVIGRAVRSYRDLSTETEARCRAILG